MIKKIFLSALLWMTALSLQDVRLYPHRLLFQILPHPPLFQAAVPFVSPAVSSAASLSETPGSTPFGEMMSALSGYQQRNRREPSEAVYRSVRCSQLAQQYDSNQEEQLRSDLDEYLNAASAETIDILAEGCGNVDFAAREILSNGVRRCGRYPERCGNPNQYDEYDPEKYEAVAGILKETLAAYT